MRLFFSLHAQPLDELMSCGGSYAIEIKSCKKKRVGTKKEPIYGLLFHFLTYLQSMPAFDYLSESPSTCVTYVVQGF